MQPKRPLLGCALSIAVLGMLQAASHAADPLQGAWVIDATSCDTVFSRRNSQLALKCDAEGWLHRPRQPRAWHQRHLQPRFVEEKGRCADRSAELRRQDDLRDGQHVRALRERRPARALRPGIPRGADRLQALQPLRAAAGSAAPASYAVRAAGRGWSSPACRRCNRNSLGASADHAKFIPRAGLVSSPDQETRSEARSVS